MPNRPPLRAVMDLLLARYEPRNRSIVRITTSTPGLALGNRTPSSVSSDPTGSRNANDALSHNTFGVTTIVVVVVVVVVVAVVVVVVVVVVVLVVGLSSGQVACKNSCDLGHCSGVKVSLQYPLPAATHSSSQQRWSLELSILFPHFSSGASLQVFALL